MNPVHPKSTEPREREREKKRVNQQIRPNVATERREREEKRKTHSERILLLFDSSFVRGFLPFLCDRTRFLGSWITVCDERLKRKGEGGKKRKD